jgi:hypothetical protein
MHNGRKLISDTFSDVYTLLEPWIDDGFWDFENYCPEPNSICVVGRKQVVDNTDKFKQLCHSDCTMVFANTAEGSATQIAHLQMLGLEELVLSGKLLLLSGGRLPDKYPHFLHEHFFVRVLAYQENLEQMSKISEIFGKTDKPYDFLFLNGRARPHRKYLWYKFRQRGLLERSIWTMMEGGPAGNRILQLRQDGIDLLAQITPVQSLPKQYEVSRYRNKDTVVKQNDSRFIKFDLFENEWGEIYLESSAYVDSYFSVVTETILDGSFSFFTEKIAKPLAMGHPWIAATNQGFYNDIRNLGFRTFGHVIDESFDNIDNAQDRIDRVVDIVTDLCQQDLNSFIKACEDICKYNQQHLFQVVNKENQTFPERFFRFIDHHG